MKNKLFIGLGITVAVLLTSAVTYGMTMFSQNSMPKTPSEYRIGVTYDKAMTDDKPVIALFYVDWCKYCQRFMPKYRTLSKLYGDRYNFLMINAEDEARKDLIEDVRITGFPTIYIIDPKYDNRFLLNNAIYMDMAKLRIEMERYLKVRKIMDKGTACSED